MNTANLTAEVRTLTGRKTKKLRRGGVLPANVYGKKTESISVQLPLDVFLKTYNQVGETGLIELSVNGDKKHVLISNVQLDPVSDTPIHVDFREVNLKEKVTAAVQIELMGESPAEKSGVGTPVQQLNEVEVEALPADLPESFTVDISVLSEVDQAIYVKDLVYDKNKMELLADDLEAIIVKIEPPQEEEVVDTAPVETETITAKDTETPTEGEAGASEESKSSE